MHTTTLLFVINNLLNIVHNNIIIETFNAKNR